jgi:hypothetical protein
LEGVAKSYLQKKGGSRETLTTVLVGLILAPPDQRDDFLKKIQELLEAAK